MTLTAWIAILAVIALFGTFLDFLFAADVREPERNCIRQYFRNLYEKTDATDFAALQVSFSKGVLKTIESTVGRRVGAARFLINVLVASALLTVIFSSLGVVLANRVFDYPTSGFPNLEDIFPPGSSAIDIVLVPFAAVFGNYLFDLLTLIVSIGCLEYVVRHKKRFALVAIFDGLVSALLLWLVLVAGSLASQLPFISDELKIDSLLWSATWPMDIFESRIGIIMLVAGSTTFIPVLIYVSGLLLLTLLKIFQWVFASLFARFSEPDADKTFFGWIGLGISLLVGTIKAVSKLS